MNYRTSYLLLWIGLLTALVLGCVSVLVGVIALAVTFLQLLLFYRCPHGRHSLPAQGLPPSCCPNCGERLG